jgi:predicted HicB family RNase H-like nuclease
MEKQLEAYRRASQVFEKSPDWAEFFREVLGIDGIVRKLYPTPQELAEFEKTQEYADIQAMLVKLREKNLNKSPESEPIRVITVRLPKSMQDALNREAIERKTSVNQLCISKLLQWVEDDRIPAGKAAAKSKKQPAREPHEVEAIAEAG